MELLEQLSHKTAQDSDTAAASYLEIIARNERPQPGDAEQLQAAMETLGITAANAQADVLAVREVSRLTDGLLTDDELTKIEADRAKEIAGFRAEAMSIMHGVIDALPDDGIGNMLALLVRSTLTPTGSAAYTKEIDLRQRADQTAQAYASKLAEDNGRRQRITDLKMVHPMAFAE